MRTSSLLKLYYFALAEKQEKKPVQWWAATKWGMFEVSGNLNSFLGGGFAPPRPRKVFLAK
jgi:hypothetical protein